MWNPNTEKRNNTIPQMRLWSVSKMRMSILNTATTEQMGYGIVSFFVCFLSMNQIVRIFLAFSTRSFVGGSIPSSGYSSPSSFHLFQVLYSQFEVVDHLALVFLLKDILVQVLSIYKSPSYDKVVFPLFLHY